MDECTKKKKKKQKYNNKNSNITVYSIECALQSGHKMKIKHKQKMGKPQIRETQQIKNEIPIGEI